MDRFINQIKAVQEQTDLEEDDRENFLDDLYAKVHGENKVMEDNIKEHENLTYQLRLMGGYIEKGNLDCNQPISVKIRSDATLALAEADRHELELDEATTRWTTNNLRYLAVRRKKKAETMSVAKPTDVKNPDRLFLGTFEKTLVPKEELRAGCEISEMKQFKKKFENWMSYIEETGNKLDDLRYWHVLSNMLDIEMKAKLDAIVGIETAGAARIWEHIEKIFQDSNPKFLRRQKALEAKRKKGEISSDFSNRLKNEWIESDMGRATIWSVFQHKIISTLDQDNSDEKELMTKLLGELKKKENPTEKDCEGFLAIIREHEAITQSRGHKEDNRKVNVVNTEEPKTTDPNSRGPHSLCGLVHGPRQCTYKCPVKGCGKAHPKEQCFILHPELRPASWRNPDKERARKDKERRDRERRNQRDRSQSESSDRRGGRRGDSSKSDKRDKSPKSPRKRVNKVDRKSETEDDSEEERRYLEKKLEKLKKKDSRTNRLRPEGPFDDESSYINLQKEFNNTRYSRDRNIRQVKKCSN